MMMYAKCVTVRDQQLNEKNVLHDHKKNEEKRKDLMMEIERLKNIKYYEELEKMKKEEQKSGFLNNLIKYLKFKIECVFLLYL